MERINLQDLAGALGIIEPWAIKSVKTDIEARIINVYIEKREKSRPFTLFSRLKKDQDEKQISGSWSYMAIGLYRCVVHATIVDRNFDGNILSTELFKLESFLGHPARNYSNYLRQQIATAQAKGLDSELIGNLFRVDQELLTRIVSDLEQLPEPLKTHVLLPSEVDPVWEKVLLARVQLQTKALPLRLLLSKLRSAALKTKNIEERRTLGTQLRNFFTANIHTMEREILQLCSINPQDANIKAQRAPAKQRIVVPGAKSILWLDVISGKINLDSKSIPLNLLISKQRISLMKAQTNRDKIQVIAPLYQYITKNYRSLKRELLILNEQLQKVTKPKVRLPSPDHHIWQNILDNENLIPSKHLAYKLLLSKLRSTLGGNQSPQEKDAAARKVHGFVSKNHASMRQELQVLMSQVA
ncbi:MAG: hypothetical protein COA42_24070 [Alteromonadaceae bacterium]|nr:MAG: hypothetical protein COA42_24070 [Alteromonadaceae bacterium]